jgi:acyl dehydratase
MIMRISETHTGQSQLLEIQRLWAFSGGPFALEGWPKRNLHTDIAVAQRQGLTKLSVSGTMYEGYLVSMMNSLIGDEWWGTGSLDIKFTKIVSADDTITPSATLTDGISNGDFSNGDLEFDVKCVNQHGEPVLVGTARISRSRR